jgi:hypothetical protein
MTFPSTETWGKSPSSPVTIICPPGCAVLFENVE